MFKFRFCSQESYESLRVAWWTNIDGSWSQECVRVKIIGVMIAYSQPNMLDDDLDPPDLCWRIGLK